MDNKPPVDHNFWIGLRNAMLIQLAVAAVVCAIVFFVTGCSGGSSQAAAPVPSEVVNTTPTGPDPPSVTPSTTCPSGETYESQTGVCEPTPTSTAGGSSPPTTPPPTCSGTGCSNAPSDPTTPTPVTPVNPTVPTTPPPSTPTTPPPAAPTWNAAPSIADINPLVPILSWSWSDSTALCSVASSQSSTASGNVFPANDKIDAPINFTGPNGQVTYTVTCDGISATAVYNWSFTTDAFWSSGPDANGNYTLSFLLISGCASNWAEIANGNNVVAGPGTSGTTAPLAPGSGTYTLICYSPSAEQWLTDTGAQPQDSYSL